MRIAIISDAVMATPTDGSHGLGRVVSIVAEGLQARGHSVTLFAKVGSHFSGELVTPLDAQGYEGERALAREALRVHRGHPFQAFLDHSHLHELARMFPDLPTVNIYHDCFQNYARCPVLLSKGQRALMPDTFGGAWIIPNSLNPDDFTPSFTPNPENYVLFMGATAELKQVVLAIEACARLGVQLLIAGQPGIDTGQHNNAQWIGTVAGHVRDNLLRGARVFLQLGYIESFGLTTLEAGLSGTPVCAWASGGTVDLIRDGVNGCYVPSTGKDQVEAVAQTIERAWWLDREKVREYAERLCNPVGQIDGYEAALKAVMMGEVW